MTNLYDDMNTICTTVGERIARTRICAINQYGEGSAPTEGELRRKAPPIFTGISSRPSDTYRFTKDGYYKTGDLKIDESGITPLQGG